MAEANARSWQPVSVAPIGLLRARIIVCPRCGTEIRIPVRDHWWVNTPRARIRQHFYTRHPELTARQISLDADSIAEAIGR
jgi:hypothetical protein